MEENFDLGDRVIYSSHFLVSIGCSATDPLWRTKGTVLKGKTPFGWVTVQWDGDPNPMRVNHNNITRPGTAKSIDLPVWYKP